MGNYQILKLKDVCDYISGRITVSVLDSNNYVSTENMQPNNGGVSTCSSLPMKGYAINFMEKDILLSNIRPYFKKIWFANKSGGCSNDVLCIRPKSNVDSTFLFYLLSQQSFFDYIMSGAKGSKMPRGDRKHIMNWDIFIPKSIDSQKRIAAILSSLDDKIALNKRINDNLQVLAA